MDLHSRPGGLIDMLNRLAPPKCHGKNGGMHNAVPCSQPAAYINKENTLMAHHDKLKIVKQILTEQVCSTMPGMCLHSAKSVFE